MTAAINVLHRVVTVARARLYLPLLVVLGLACASAPAYAGNGYEKVTSTFGSEGTGSGQFKEPTSIAVNDETGDVYVLDSGNDRVEWFSPEVAGKFKFQGEFDGSGTHSDEGKAAGSGAGETLTGKFLKPGGIAVDNAAGPSYGDVYVADTGPGHEVVDKFSPTGKYEGQLTGTCTEEGKVPPTCEGGGTFVPFVDLLNVTTDAAGDVWVYEGNGPIASNGLQATQVDELSDAGSAMEMRPLDGNGETVGGESEFPGLAVNSSGAVFVAAGSLEEYPTAAGGRIKIKERSSELAALAMISANDDLLVDEGSTIELYKSPIAGSAQASLTFPSTGLSESTGIAVNGAKGEGTIYATQRGSDNVDVFESEPAKAPVVVNESASTVEVEEGVDAVEFAVVIDPENRATTYSFEYSTEASENNAGELELEGEIETVSGAAAIPAEFGDQTATSPAVEGLSPRKTIYYRVVAENEESKGTATVGKVEAYTKVPLIAESEEKVSELTSTSAKLEATINPVFEVTEYTIEYAIEPALLGTSKASIAGVGETEAGGAPEQVSAEIFGLTPGQTYYYRVVAQNPVTQYKNNANKGEPVASKIKELTPYAAPAVVTGEAQNIIGTAATLSGEVDPEGTEATYYFAYISKAGFEYAIAHGAANPEAGEATYKKELAEGARSPYAEGETTETSALPVGDHPVTVGPIPADDLLPGETYHYALVATNKFEVQSAGPDRTFTARAGTPPLVSTGAASAVSQNAATMSGTVTTNGLATSYAFEVGVEPGVYGPSTGLGSVGGATTEEVTAIVTGLQPGTAYYYRLKATNNDGTVYGQPEAFSTASVPYLLAVPTSLTLAFPANDLPKQDHPNGAGPKPLTNKQKLAKALKACRKDKKKSKRRKCEHAAKSKYKVSTKKRDAQK